MADQADAAEKLLVAFGRLDPPLQRAVCEKLIEQLSASPEDRDAAIAALGDAYVKVKAYRGSEPELGALFAAEVADILRRFTAATAPLP